MKTRMTRMRTRKRKKNVRAAKKGKSKDWQSRNFLDDDDLEFEFLDLK